jgi:cell division protein FtsL
MARVSAGAIPQGQRMPLPAATRGRTRWVSLTSLGTVGLAVVALAMALGIVWQHVYAVRLGYEIERLREQQSALVQEGKTLKLELGKLRSMRRVEEVARGRLGMVSPQPGQVVVIQEPPVQ